MNNYKLTNDIKQQIKDLKGKQSGYSVANNFNVSTTLVYRLWNENHYIISDVFSTLKKMIPPFIEKKIELNLTKGELKVLIGLIKEIEESKQEKETEVNKNFNFSEIEIKETVKKIERSIVEEDVVDEEFIEDIVEQFPELVEKDLKIIDRQKFTIVGQIDLLAKDSNGKIVVLELKRNKGTDKVLGQISRYMGAIKNEFQLTNENIRGIIVCSRTSKRLELAASIVPNVSIFSFEK